MDTFETPRTAALEIVDHMNDDDRTNYVANRTGWRAHLSDQLQGAWAHLDLDAVMAELDAIARRGWSA